MSLDSFPTLNNRLSHSPSTSNPSLARASSLDGPSAAALADASTDAWLWRVLQNEKNRDMIARLEDTLTSFVNDDEQTSLAFPPRNPFHRKVCYAVARRYGLDHRLETLEPALFLSPSATPSPSSSDNMRLVLLKTTYSASPSSRLAVFADGPPPPAALNPPTHQTVAFMLRLSSETTLNSVRFAPSASALADTDTSRLRPATFLRRPRPADGKIPRPPIASSSQTKSSGSTTAIKRMSEEDYEKARARIFSASNGVSKVVDDTDEGKTKLTTWTLSQDGGSSRIAAKPVSIAKGPVEGSCGFERRRNRRGGGNGTPAHSSLSPVVSGTSFADGKQSTRKSGYADINTRGTTRPGRDVNRSGSTAGSVTATPTSTANCVSSGGPRRYTNDSTFGDLQDPDFDRSYMKWARREPTCSAPTSQTPAVGLPIYAAPLIYPYATQELQHSIHSATVSGHSPMTLSTAAPLLAPHVQAGLSTGLTTGVLGMHHRGILTGATGISISMGLGIGSNIVRRDIIDGSGNGQMITTLDQRCRENGSVLFATPNLGISCGVGSGGSAVSALPIRRSSIQDMSALPDTHEMCKLGVPIGLSQPQHTVSAIMNWPSQSMPTAVRSSSPPAYGLDSTVDFPPLR